MKCPNCISENKKSCVYEGMTTSTLLYFQPYYDEDGKYHYHDLNTSTTHYKCTNNHEWYENTKSTQENLLESK